MVKKTSSENKTNADSTKEDAASKPTPTKTSARNTVKKPRVSAARKRTVGAKAKPSTASNKMTAEKKTTTKAETSSTLKTTAPQIETKRAVKEGVLESKQTSEPISGDSLQESSTAGQPGDKESRQAPQQEVSASRTEVEEPQYQEPETPMVYAAAPAVEDVESLSPPIPEATVDEGQGEVMHYDHQHEQPGPQYSSMFIVQITPELAPVAKVGGLADVVAGLSRELEIRGNTVEIILPKYDSMRYDQIWGLCTTFDDLWVPWYGGHVHCTVWFGFVHERKCFFIEPHSPDNFFKRGSIYGFDDDILRFTFFSRAAIEFLWKSGKHPDIIHCHDWQTALVPVFLYEIYQHLGMTHPRVCYTIHNFKHQGVTGEFLLDASGLYRPEYYFHYDRLLDNHIPHALNLMKGGVVYSNFVTTVSPKYAGETKDGGQGFGLEPTLQTHHYKYGGIVNGIDYDAWNPEIDPHIPQHYNVNNIDQKYANKHALRGRLLLSDSEKPIIAFIGRLDPQKGLDLVRHALFYALNNAAQFVLLGSSPDNEINNYFWELKRHLNDSPDCHIEVGFDEDLAHLIYAGADMIIVPSLFEPCGLTQLIAMQYGTIPVVRSVGGLADTVFDKDNAHDKPLHERNGFVFENYDNAGIESALSRAIACYYQYPEHFRDLMQNAMRYDFSWKNPGQHYLNIYDYIRNK
jgi:starch synthase